MPFLIFSQKKNITCLSVGLLRIGPVFFLSLLNCVSVGYDKLLFNERYMLLRYGLHATSQPTELPNGSFQDKHFYKAYVSALIAISFVFIYSLSQKLFLTEMTNGKN